MTKRVFVLRIIVTPAPAGLHETAELNSKTVDMARPKE